jgi:hypothetical protein
VPADVQAAATGDWATAWIRMTAERLLSYADPAVLAAPVARRRTQRQRRPPDTVARGHHEQRLAPFFRGGTRCARRQEPLTSLTTKPWIAVLVT